MPRLVRKFVLLLLVGASCLSCGPNGDRPEPSERLLPEFEAGVTATLLRGPALGDSWLQGLRLYGAFDLPAAPRAATPLRGSATDREREQQAQAQAAWQAVARERLAAAIIAKRPVAWRSQGRPTWASVLVAMQWRNSGDRHLIEPRLHPVAIGHWQAAGGENGWQWLPLPTVPMSSGAVLVFAGGEQALSLVAGEVHAAVAGGTDRFPLPGAQLNLVGSALATISDDSGRYVMALPSGRDWLLSAESPLASGVVRATSVALVSQETRAEFVQIGWRQRLSRAGLSEARPWWWQRDGDADETRGRPWPDWLQALQALAIDTVVQDVNLPLVAAKNSPAAAQLSEPLAIPTPGRAIDPDPPHPRALLLQRDPGGPTPLQHDLGCAGNGGKSLMMDGRSFYTLRLGGWRSTGDVLLSRVGHESIFGAPGDVQAEMLVPADDAVPLAWTAYADQLPGYCMLSTGTSQYERNEARAPRQRPQAGQGRVAQMWQTVTLPRGAQSMQLRFAVLSQEPAEARLDLRSDQIFVRFDGAPGHGWARRLAYLPGWQTVTGPLAHADVWGFNLSHGAWPEPYSVQSGPHRLCLDLPTKAISAPSLPLQIRMGVVDGSDDLGDTALLVDTMSFGRQSCAQSPAMSPEAAL